MGKEKRHQVIVNRHTAESSFEAVIEESRSLRRQMADDLSREARQLRRISRHFDSRQSRNPDEHFA